MLIGLRLGTRGCNHPSLWLMLTQNFDAKEEDE
jgi:hypothetical protein